MKKIVFLTTLFLLFYISGASVDASLLVVTKEGEVVWNVLSQEDSIELGIPKHSEIGVSKIADSDVKVDVVYLRKDNEKASLVVEVQDQKKELTVTNWGRDLVEIEERPEFQKVKIGIVDDQFSLEQKGVIALTEYPVTIDIKTAEFSVTTPSGDRFIAILPFGAVESALRAKLISGLPGGKIFLNEQERELYYLIKGEKSINFFNVFTYSFGVTTKVSALTGEIISIDNPEWLRFLGFLFS